MKARVAQFNSLKYDHTIQQIFSVLSQDIDKISGETLLHQEALSLLEKHAPEFNRFEQAIGIMLQLFDRILWIGGSRKGLLLLSFHIYHYRFRCCGDIRGSMRV